MGIPGTPQHNLTLSQQRSDAVKTQLIAMGVDPVRLTTKGFGDTKPMASNLSPESKQITAGLNLCGNKCPLMSPLNYGTNFK